MVYAGLIINRLPSCQSSLTASWQAHNSCRVTGFDIIVLVIVGIAAVGGFLRGLLREVLSLAAWLPVLFAIHNLHDGLTEFIAPYVSSPTIAALSAFTVLLLIPYAAMKLIETMLSGIASGSVVRPIDKLLGFGFGAVKGVIMAVLAFSVLAIGYDTVWGASGRPGWITTARSYPFINASSGQLVKLLEERRRILAEEEGKALRTKK